MNLPLEVHPQGVVLRVKAQPGARQVGVGPVQDGCLKARVTEAPERGKANRALRGLLARQLGVRKSQVELIQGETHNIKQFLITGISLQELRLRLARLAPGEVPGETPGEGAAGE